MRAKWYRDIMNHTGRGLCVKAPWSDLILNGVKTWEIRGSRTNIRGTIGIIQSGTGLVMGSADLIDCIGPLTPEQMNANFNNHRVYGQFVVREHPSSAIIFAQDCVANNETPMPYKNSFAWVLTKAKLFTKPVPYKHPMGAVIWVRL